MIKTVLVCVMIVAALGGLGGRAACEFMNGSRNAAFWFAAALAGALVALSVIAAVW